MTEDKNRFIDSGVGITWLKQTSNEATWHETPTTEGTITEQSEENS